MTWIVDTDLHIHAPSEDPESLVLYKATKHARMFNGPNVMVDTKLEKDIYCACPIPGKENLSFYWLIMHFWEEDSN